MCRLPSLGYFALVQTSILIVMQVWWCSESGFKLKAPSPFTSTQWTLSLDVKKTINVSYATWRHLSRKYNLILRHICYMTRKYTFLLTRPAAPRRLAQRVSKRKGCEIQYEINPPLMTRPFPQSIHSATTAELPSDRKLPFSPKQRREWWVIRTILPIWRY